MSISVIVCTCNRAQSLGRTLQSLAVQKHPPATEWEILVVDNNSRDNTKQVVSEYCQRYPARFRYVFEAQPGKSFALNTGVREAKGSILAFTDDDVLADENWLRCLTDPLKNSEWSGSGGRVLPDWSCTPPEWLPTEGSCPLAPLALFDLGPDACQLSQNPYGVNMAIRREMFEKHGTFRTDLGPRANSDLPQKNEDAEFGRRLLAAGERFYYSSEAVVHHHVPESRLTKQYFLSWWFDKGRSDTFEALSHTTAKSSGVSVQLLARLLWSIARWMLAIRPQHRFYRKAHVWYVAGEIVERHRHSSQAGISKGKRECNVEA